MGVVPFSEFQLIIVRLLFKKLVNTPAIRDLISASYGQLQRQQLLSLSVPHCTAPIPSVIWLKGSKRISLSGSRNSKLFELVPECSLQSTLSIIREPALGFKLGHCVAPSLGAMGDFSTVRVKPALSLYQWV